MAVQKDNELNDAQKRFCEEYIYDFNGSRSYKVAYPSCKTDVSARVCSSNLLKNDRIQKYIKKLSEKYNIILKEKQYKQIENIDNIGYIYIIKCENTNYYKIGKSLNGVYSRMRFFQTGIPFNLIVCLNVKCKNFHLLEKELHNKYKKYNVRGKWFEFTEEKYKIVKNNIIKNGIQ